MKLPIIIFVCLAFVASEFISVSSSALPKDDQTYVLGTQKASWEDAYVLCKEGGMELASVNTDAEEAAIEKYLNTYDVKPGVFDAFWLAGTRYGAIASDFVWFTTGHPIIYRRFAPGEPNNLNDKEYCLEIFLDSGTNSYGWNDAPCETELQFLCQTSK